MHELAIAQSILAITLEEVEEHSAQQVHSITLRLGAMTGVEPEALRFCFSILAEGTKASGAMLQFVLVPLMARCAECKNEYAIDRYQFFCPDCGSARLEMLSGRELQVDHLEVE